MTGWREPGARRGELLRRLLGRGRRGDARLDATPLDVRPPCEDVSPFGLPEVSSGYPLDERERRAIREHLAESAAERAQYRGQGPSRP